MTDLRLTQQVLEVLRTGIPDAQLTQVVLEVVRVDSGTGVVSAVSLTGRLQLLVSGVSVVNALGLRPLTVSAEWIVSGGASAFSYAWSFELPTSTSAVSAVTRTFSAGSGFLGVVRVSALVSDASAASLTSAFVVHLRRAGVPNPFDGRVVYESQAKRRLWPT
jgi:hypothetical protein